MKIQSLEQVLVDMQLVDDSGLDKARTLQREKALPLHDALLSSGVLSDQDILKALARLWNIPLMNKIDEIEVDPSIIDVLPITFLRKYTMVPVKLNADMMEVAVNDPTDQEPLFDIAKILNIREITRVLAPKQEILQAINRLVEMMEERGVVGPQQGSRPREVL